MPLNYKTKVTGKGNKFNQQDQPSPNNRQRVLFACDSRDFDKYFDEITDDILIKQPNIAIYFYDTSDQVTRVIMEEDLTNIILFIIPVTLNTIRDDCDLQKYIDFAHEKLIRLLFIQCEQGIENLFNKKYGNYQLLNKYDFDPTALGYDEKLTKYLESAIIGDELAEQIRQAFDAYIFLSYRKKDRKYANELMRLIHSNDFCRDIAIWYDEYLVPGEDFNDAIAAAMEKSGLFTMLVTPNLVNEENYVHTVEFPEAKKANKPIFPAEAEKTDKQKLSEMFEGLNETVKINGDNFTNELKKSIEKIALKENDKDPKHNYLIGLAYLNGIDVEVNREKAIELITGAADSGLIEAMDKLFDMYSIGEGVECNYTEAAKWKKQMVDALDANRNESEESLYKYAWSCHDLALIFRSIDNKNAVDYFEKSIGAWHNLSKINADKYEIFVARVYNDYALYYKEKGNNEDAEKYRKESLTIRERLYSLDPEKYAWDMGSSYNNLGVFYKNRNNPDENDFKEAEKYLNKALSIREKILQKNQEFFAYKNIAETYNNLGNLYAMSKDKDKQNKAAEYFLDAINLYTVLNNNKCTMGTELTLMGVKSNYAVLLLNNIEQYSKRIEKILKDNIGTLNKYITLNESLCLPKLMIEYNLLAVLYDKKGFHKKEIEVYKQAINDVLNHNYFSRDIDFWAIRFYYKLVCLLTEYSRGEPQLKEAGEYAQKGIDFCKLHVKNYYPDSFCELIDLKIALGCVHALTGKIDEGYDEGYKLLLDALNSCRNANEIKSDKLFYLEAKAEYNLYSLLKEKNNQNADTHLKKAIEISKMHAEKDIGCADLYSFAVKSSTSCKSAVAYKVCYMTFYPD